MAFIKHLGLILCFTAVKSSQAKGLAEAFVEKLKQNYTCINDRLDAKTVKGYLNDWFYDHKENHHRKRLRLISPEEFMLEATAE